ncbi:MAG TPA: succinate dehydrogenase, cytochrome b556 subunit [Steroidobacteraceae bacterium]|nr:succinate dehydrogenase, cytochrome b556 subunit [Steroidobacteraceae bacterium]
MKHVTDVPATTPANAARPLSPFLTYKWRYTMALSFLNRVTGSALTVGSLLFVYWLVAISNGADTYAAAQQVFGHPVVKFLLVVFSYSFFYHLLGGVRHLVWDTGYGLERRSARLSGWVAFLGSIVLTAFFWFLILHGSRGAA